MASNYSTSQVDKEIIIFTRLCQQGLIMAHHSDKHEGEIWVTDKRGLAGIDIAWLAPDPPPRSAGILRSGGSDWRPGF
jgi:hypothetical protein